MKEVKLPCFLPNPTGLRLSCSSPKLPATSKGRRAREGADAVLSNGTFSSPQAQISCRRVAWRKVEFCSRVAEACESTARRSLAIFIHPTVTASPQRPWFKGGLVMVQTARSLWSNRQRRLSQEMVTTQCDKCGSGGSPVQFSHSVVSDSLRPHELQHARPPCPSPAPRVYSNSCPSGR